MLPTFWVRVFKLRALGPGIFSVASHKEALGQGGRAWEGSLPTSRKGGSPWALVPGGGSHGAPGENPGENPSLVDPRSRGASPPPWVKYPGICLRALPDKGHKANIFFQLAQRERHREKAEGAAVRL